ncbi:DUF6916 family protein [Granulicella paludicola]|uniref:DUF6916 family protein n=1 Tax=Granulicella paludicola TaxID=474951 RepID=UPI0021E0C2FA|nr:hypothetical protein [Granulicella paludicola]
MATRRHFLALSSAALAWAASTRKLFAQASNRLGIPRFSNAALGAYQQGLLTRTNFESVVGSSFHIYMDNQQISELQLAVVTSPYDTTVTDQPTRPGAIPIKRPSPKQTFAVKFTSGSTSVPQDSYVVDHGTLGSFSVFLVPGPKSANANTCTATFYYL